MIGQQFVGRMDSDSEAACVMGSDFELCFHRNVVYCGKHVSLITLVLICAAGPAC